MALCCTGRPLTWTPRTPSPTTSQVPRRSTQKLARAEAGSSTGCKPPSGARPTATRPWDSGTASSSVPGARNVMAFTPAIYNIAMSRIDIRHLHTLAPDAARKAVEDAVVQLGHKVGLDYRWEGDSVHFVRPGVEGRMDLLPGQVHVTAKLGLLFAAMRGTIETELLRLLKERL